MSTEASHPSLADLGERQIYEQILKPRYRDVPAFGDDCADLGGGLVVTTDSCPTPLLQRLGETDPYYEGWLLATINLSDLAAAGAEPLGLVVSYTLPSDTPVWMLERIIAGVDDCSDAHGTRVLGGDLRDGREPHLSATAIGRRKGRALGRKGANAGDELLLVGHPGYLWAAALVHRDQPPGLIPAEVEAVFAMARRPRAQITAGTLLAELGLATAAIDVSDGLYAAVRILAGTNGLGARMAPKIELDPVVQRVGELCGVSSFQLGQNWGDWCLLVAVAPGSAEPAERLLDEHGIGVRRVGTLTDDGALVVGCGTDVRPWVGVDQERFTPRSWHGDGIDAHIALMKELSRRPAL